MIGIDVVSLENKKVSEAELDEEIFNVPIKYHVLHQVVLGQMSDQRAGTARAKTRSEVKASGRKLWRQKGTGRARVGAASSPTRRGGGVVFPPVPKKSGPKVSKKLKKAGLCMALTDKVRNDQLILVDGFALPEGKTKAFVQIMKKFDVKKALIVTEGRNDNLDRSSRNVPWVKVMRHEGLNVYDVLRYDSLFMEQSAISKVQEALRQ